MESRLGSVKPSLHDAGIAAFGALMSQSNISDESPMSPGQRVTCIDRAVALCLPGCIDCFGKLPGLLFPDVVFHFGHDGFIGVPLPASRAIQSILGVWFNRSFQRYLAARAEKIDSGEHARPWVKSGTVRQVSQGVK